MALTREQREVINLLKDRDNITYISQISLHEMKTYYEFFRKNSQAFEIVLYTDKSLTANSTMLVISPTGKIAFYDRFFDLDFPEKKFPLSWSKQRSINLCKKIGLSPTLLTSGINLITLKTLNKLFNAANTAEAEIVNEANPQKTMKYR